MSRASRKIVFKTVKEFKGNCASLPDYYSYENERAASTVHVHTAVSFFMHGPK